MRANDGSGKTILLVEDEPALRELMRRCLDDSGYVLMTAAHGEDALALVTRADTTLDLVVTDVFMPRMSGRILAQRLAEVNPDVRILFVTGQADAMPAVRAGLMQTPHPFLLKPFTPADLVRKVRQTLEAPAPRVGSDLPTTCRQCDADAVLETIPVGPGTALQHCRSCHHSSLVDVATGAFPIVAGDPRGVATRELGMEPRPCALRFAVRLPARYAVDGCPEWHPSIIENLSTSGVRFRPDTSGSNAPHLQELRPDALIELTTLVPGGRDEERRYQVTCRGQIARIEEPRHPTETCAVSVAVVGYRLTDVVVGGSRGAPDFVPGSSPAGGPAPPSGP